MKTQKYFFFMLIQVMSLSNFAMEKEKIKEEVIKNKEELSLEKRRRDIFFKTVATFTVGLDNKRVNQIIDENHPFLEYGEIPYKSGNGGLLNPVLHTFGILKETVSTKDYKGVKIAIEGHVAADGIDENIFDKKYSGKSNFSNVSEYKMSLLEKAILGFLKERAIDRHKSDLTKTFFGHGEFAEKFVEFLKHEWTSTQNEQDKGIRTPQETKLVQRHMMSSTQLHNPENMRTGECIRRELLDGENDKFASVVLDEFEVLVKIPGKDLQDCCIL